MSIRILIAGDYCPSDRISKKIEKREYDFLPKLSTLGPIDYSIVNLECPLYSGPSKPIQKFGPNLKSSPEAIIPLKVAGFNCVTLANNHFRDYDDDGCRSTIEVLEKNNFEYVGGGLSLEQAQKTLYFTIQGKRISIINVCENEFSVASNSRAGSAPLSIVDNYYKIKEARKNSDYLIMIVHGGHEMYQLPSLRMKKLYRFFIDLGVDAVVNHHQHCYSGYEFYNDKPIVYGLGNFCFDSNEESSSIWNEGYMAILILSDDKISLELKPYEQCKQEPNVTLLSSDKADLFNLNLLKLNDIISDDCKLKQAYDAWVSKETDYKLSIFSSYHNHLLDAAVSHKLLPRLFKRKEALAILNHIVCESHRDISISVLNNYLKLL